MPRVSPIQESFAYGEIDERLRSRVSLDAYRQGLKRMRNWYPLVQGPARMREGSLFLEPVDSLNWASADTSTTGLRSITFQRGLDNDVVFEIGSNELIGRSSVDGSVLVNGESTNLVVDSQYSQPIPGVYWVKDDYAFDFNGGTIPVIVGPYSGGTPDAHVQLRCILDNFGQDFAGGALDRATGTGVIVIPSGSELLVNTITLDIGFAANTAMAIGLGNPALSPLKLRLRIGTAPGLADVHDATINFINFIARNQYVENFTPGAGNNALYMSIGWEWTGGVIPACIPIFGPCTQQISMNIYPVNWTAPLTGGAGTDLKFASPWTAEQMECLQWDQDVGEQYGLFTHPDVEPHVLKYVAPDWIFQPISNEAGYVAPTGSAWGANDYPAACAFHEGRAWFGGSPSFPTTLWASRSGVYVDLDAAVPANKADPLLFPLSQSGAIQTLTSKKELVINTNIAEIIGTSVQGVIAFDDFSFPTQTDWGSNCVQPIKVGREVVYTSNSRKRIRTFADEGGTNYGWDGNELSLLANSIFGSAVRRMVYLDEPGYQACFLLSDGTMGMCTYYYPEDVTGWWRYTTAFNGQTPDEPGLPNQPVEGNAAQDTNTIMDITKVNTSAGAKLWMTINRVGYSGTQKVGHELLAFETGIVAALDSFAVRSPYDVLADGTLRVDDIDELTDQSCSVLVEQVDPNSGQLFYTVHPKVTVIAGVSSPLENWVVDGVVYIGLAYDNDIQLLSLEGSSRRGTAQVQKRRWNKVYARLNNSPVPIIQGVAAQDRTPSTPMGLGEPRMTGDTEIVDLGSGEGDLLITQDKPMITEITGIFGKVQGSET